MYQVISVVFFDRLLGSKEKRLPGMYCCDIVCFGTRYLLPHVISNKLARTGSNYLMIGPASVFDTTSASKKYAMYYNETHENGVRKERGGNIFPKGRSDEITFKYD